MVMPWGKPKEGMSVPNHASYVGPVVLEQCLWVYRRKGGHDGFSLKTGLSSHGKTKHPFLLLGAHYKNPCLPFFQGTKISGTDVPNSSSCPAPSGLNSSPSMTATVTPVSQTAVKAAPVTPAMTATVTPVSQTAVKAAPVTPATHVTPETAAPVTPGQGVKRSRSNEKGAEKSGDNAATWTKESCLDAHFSFLIELLYRLYTRFYCILHHVIVCCFNIYVLMLSRFTLCLFWIDFIPHIYYYLIYNTAYTLY